MDGKYKLLQYYQVRKGLGLGSIMINHIFQIFSKIQIIEITSRLSADLMFKVVCFNKKFNQPLGITDNIFFGGTKFNLINVTEKM